MAPRSDESAHRQLQKGEDLDRILTLCERRTLSKNLTLSYDKVIYQIETNRAAYTMRNAKVEVRETSAGQITIEYKGRALDHSVYHKQERQQARVIPSKLLQLGSTARGAAELKPTRGPVSTPWRNFSFGKNSLQAKARRGELCILPK